MLKLAVVIAVSKYAGSGLCDLPGCFKDGELLQAILSGQEGYQDILYISNNTNSAEVKRQLIDYVNKYKDQEISEFVFFFSGHGTYADKEFYYLFSDYQQARLRQTSLENTELDNLIRSLRPRLTTKIVDSCQSGLPYIKDRGEIHSYLKGTGSEFQSCYFLFSSQLDEASYQNDKLSDFTRSIGELVASRTGVIRHKDIIDYISDLFSSNNLQTPFFVVQADFTDLFCIVSDSLQKKVADLLTNVGSSLGEGGPSVRAGANLKTLVEADAKSYCTKQEATDIIVRLGAIIAEMQPPPEIRELYLMKVDQVSDYSGIPGMRTIGLWLLESKHLYFAEPTRVLAKVKRPKFMTMKTRFDLMRSGDLLAEEQVEEVMEQVVSGARPTCEMPFAALTVRAIPMYPNLNATSCILVPYVSRTHVLLFSAIATYQDVEKPLPIHIAI